MNSLQKLGGFAALIDAATFIAGFALFFTLLAPYVGTEVAPEQYLAFLAENQSILHVWNLIIYVIFGIFLVFLALALYERLKEKAPALAQSATVFGLMWAGVIIAAGMVANVGMGNVLDLYQSNPAQASALWLAVDSIQSGLGGGNEIIGGLWVLLISWAGLRSGGLPRLFNIMGILIGAAGVITIIPGLQEAGAIFGLGMVLWFIGVGLILLIKKA
ncbi:hypothetical protein MASR2M15_22220 [Anaerolineales bacterium]